MMCWQILFGMLPDFNIFSCSGFNHKGIVSKAIILCATKSKTEAQSRFICHPLSKGTAGRGRKLPLRPGMRGISDFSYNTWLAVTFAALTQCR